MMIQASEACGWVTTAPCIGRVNKTVMDMLHYLLSMSRFSMNRFWIDPWLLAVAHNS